MIHLDLKPANIFIAASGRFKIGDFGMASFWPRRRTEEQILSSSSEGGFEREGDKMYLAAEVLRGHYGKETDIFRYATRIALYRQDQVLMVAHDPALA